jgi:hypothetical protein
MKYCRVTRKHSKASFDMPIRLFHEGVPKLTIQKRLTARTLTSCKLRRSRAAPKRLQWRGKAASESSLKATKSHVAPIRPEL